MSILRGTVEVVSIENNARGSGENGTYHSNDQKPHCTDESEQG